MSKKQGLAEKKEKEAHKFSREVLVVTNRYGKPWLAQTYTEQNGGEEEQHEHREKVLRLSLLYWMKKRQLVGVPNLILRSWGAAGCRRSS